MLNAHTAQVLAHQHVAELQAEADARRERRSLRAARVRPPFRVRMGWMLVTAGLRLTLRDRAPTTPSLTLRRS